MSRVRPLFMQGSIETQKGGKKRSKRINLWQDWSKEISQR